MSKSYANAYNKNRSGGRFICRLLMAIGKNGSRFNFAMRYIVPILFTIFTCGENFVEFVNSEPVRNHITKLDLYRINDASKIEPKIHEKFSEFTEADAKKLKENLIAEIRSGSNQ